MDPSSADTDGKRETESVRERKRNEYRMVPWFELAPLLRLAPTKLNCKQVPFSRYTSNISVAQVHLEINKYVVAAEAGCFGCFAYVHG